MAFNAWRALSANSSEVNPPSAAGSNYNANKSERGSVLTGQAHMGSDDLRSPETTDDSAGADEGAQRQLRYLPSLGISPGSAYGKVGQSHRSAEEHADSERQQRSRKTQPGSEHGHQVGFAEAQDFLPLDEPVDPPDEHDQSA